MSTHRLKFIQRATCAVCGSSSNQVRYRRGFTDPEIWGILEPYYGGRLRKEFVDGADYEILTCDACGFTWQSWILDDEGMALLYESWICPKESRAKKTNATRELFRDYACEAYTIGTLIPKLPKDIEVLDFGMGWGFWARMAQSFGYSVAGCEISPARIAYARDRGLEVFEGEQELTSRRFDFINAEQVFEHLPDPMPTLRHLVSLLRDGGVIRLSVPNGLRAIQGLGKPSWRPMKALHPLEHINCFTHETLALFGRGAGLMPVSVPVYGMVVGNREALRFLGRSMLSRLKPAGTAIYFKRSPQSTAVGTVAAA